MALIMCRGLTKRRITPRNVFTHHDENGGKFWLKQPRRKDIPRMSKYFCCQYHFKINKQAITDYNKR